MKTYQILLSVLLQPVESVLGRKRIEEIYNELSNAFAEIYDIDDVENLIPNLLIMLKTVLAERKEANERSC